MTHSPSAQGDASDACACIPDPGRQHLEVGSREAPPRSLTSGVGHHGVVLRNIGDTEDSGGGGRPTLER